jgi:hypothetical protein
MAYLSNTLAPVWNLAPFDGKLLKRKGGPYYPELQWDLDRLVGKGIARVSDIHYVQNDHRWEIEARYRLEPVYATRVIEQVHATGFQPEMVRFFYEIADAIAMLPSNHVGPAFLFDATYGDPSVDYQNVVDFAEGRQKNFAANAARTFRPDLGLTASERVNLYVSHLHQRFLQHAG